MNLNTGYFVGSLILGIPWFAVYLLRKDLRKELLFSSFAILPFAFTAPFFIPEYWSPSYLFGFIPGLRIGVEDLLFSFFVGGIASVLFEFIENKKEVKFKKLKFVKHYHFWPFVLGLTGIFLLESLFPSNTMFNLIYGALVTTIYVICFRKDLLTQALASGILFSILYLSFFCLFNYLYPKYIAQVYTHSNLIGISIIGVPIEELLFAFVLGSAWSIFYEYALNYKSK